jgi:hypothetical protein
MGLILVNESLKMNVIIEEMIEQEVSLKTVLGRGKTG